jgi:hypothetical protein
MSSFDRAIVLFNPPLASRPASWAACCSCGWRGEFRPTGLRALRDSRKHLRKAHRLEAVKGPGNSLQLNEAELDAIGSTPVFAWASRSDALADSR